MGNFVFYILCTLLMFHLVSEIEKTEDIIVLDFIHWILLCKMKYSVGSAFYIEFAL